MAEQFWINDPVAQPTQQRGPVVIPNEGALRDDARADKNLDLSEQGSDRSTKGQVQDYRKEYHNLPEVKTYSTALTSLSNAVKRAPDANGDIALIYDYAKALDPESVVRESEVAMAQSGSPVLQSILAKLKKEFGYEEGGILPPGGRAYIKREIFNSAMTRRRAYEQKREYYSELARLDDYDPYKVIGPDIGEPYREELSKYKQTGEAFTPEELAARAGLTTEQPNESLLNPLAGERVGELNMDALGPGQKFAFDENGQPIGIINADGSWGGGYSQIADEMSEKEAEDLLRSRGEDYIDRAESGQAGLSKGVTLNLSDEISGLVGGVSDLLTGGDFQEGYTRERDVERAAQRISQRNKGVRPEIIGGFLTPGLGALGQARTVSQFARQGATLGAVAGVGEGEGGVDTISKGLTGAGLGTIAGAGVGKVAPYVAPAVEKVASGVSRVFPNAARGGEFADAAARQGLDYMPADRPGALGSQLATGVSKVTLGGVPIAYKADKIIAKAATRKNEIARAIGPAANDTSEAGQAVKRGLTAWDAATKDKGGKLFEAIPISPSAAADVTNTRAALGELTAGMSSNPALSELTADATMKAYREALESGGLSWADLKKFRSFIGEKRGTAKFSDGSSQADLGKLYGALSDDMRATAAATSPGALKAFTRANDYWRGRETRLENVSKMIFGNASDKSDAAAYNQLMSWAKADNGDFKKLYAAMRSLPEEEANIVRATVVSRLGKATAGTQDDVQSVFSPNTFVTSWSKLDQRAKNILFQGQHRKDIDDFAKVMSGIKGSERFANTSKTGLPVSVAATVSALFSEPVTGTALATGQLALGALLSSRTVARWMSALFRKPNPQAVVRHIERLESVARSEPAIAADIFTLQQRLAEAFSQPLPGRLAAQENDPEGQRPPQEKEQADGPR